MRPDPHTTAVLALCLLAGPAQAVLSCEFNGEQVMSAQGFTSGGESGLLRCTDDEGPVRLREQILRDGRVVLSIGTLADGSLSELRCAPVSLLPQDQAVCGHQGRASEVTLYRAPGQASGRVSYLAGALQGLTVLSGQGVLVRSEELRQLPGEPARRIKRVYHPTGQLRSETDLLERDPAAAGAGREGVGREWAAGGQLTQETLWADGHEVRIRQWYLNGQLKMHQQVRREGRHERRITESFWDTGRPSAINAERNGRLWGWQRYFNEAGALLREDEHGERGVLLRRRYYNPQGALEREERLMEDGSLT